MCEKDPLGLGCKSTFLEGGGLIKYQWTTLTKYNGEDFFETDAEPSLDDSEDDGEFKEYLKEEYE